MNTIDYLSDLESRVTSDWRHLSVQRTASGVRCVGHVPQVGDLAWLHRFYPGISAAELDWSERRMSRPIPPAWREVLEAMSGLTLFIGDVSLSGLLSGGLMRRNPEDPGPFSIESDNGARVRYGPLVARDDFVIGGSAAGQGGLYVLHLDQSVSKTDVQATTLLARWSSVPEMLDAEYGTFAALYDRDGNYHPRP